MCILTLDFGTKTVAPQSLSLIAEAGPSASVDSALKLFLIASTRVGTCVTRYPTTPHLRVDDQSKGSIDSVEGGNQGEGISDRV